MSAAAPVLSSPWKLLVLCLVSCCWAFSFGAGSALASVFLEEAGYSATVIGVNTGIYYLGIALTSCAVPWIMRRWARGTLLVGMLVSGLTVVAFPWGGTLLGWSVLRGLNGAAAAISLIPLETLVNQASPPGRRSRNFGFYAFAIALGMALGTVTGLSLYPHHHAGAFILGGGLSLVCGTVLLSWLPWVMVAEEARDRTPLCFGRNFPSFGSAWSQGFLEGGMVALLPVYLLSLGFSDVGVGRLMGGLMIGVIAFQVPVAWLADRLGRLRVLAACSVVVAVGLVWLPFCVRTVELATALFLVGACSGAFYPLGLAILGERLPSGGLARANAWYLGINCLGSLCGPVLCGRAWDAFGKRAMFAVGEAAVLCVLFGWLASRLYYGRRAPTQVLPNPGLGQRDAAGLLVPIGQSLRENIRETT